MADPRNAMMAMAQSDDPEARNAMLMFDRNQQYARPGPYLTTLPPEAEAAFRQWVQANRVPFDPDDPRSDYDMRGYWMQLQQGGGPGTAINPNDHRLHYPDTYKTPYHRSFSRESRYAQPNAPYWLDNRYLVDSQGPVFDEQNPQRFRR